jgi:hypothetical protein
MRIKHTRPLPKSFARHPKGKHYVVHEADIFPSRRARLAVKLLIFAHPHDLRKFWKDVLGGADLGAGCKGAVNAMGYTSERIWSRGRVERHWVCDPRYFCVMGLCIGYLNMEIVSHEAVHAGFCYARRRGRDPWNDDKGLGEEDVAYPAGAIAAGINRYLHDKGLYEKEQVRA